MKHPPHTPILPPATIAILGGGQLGAMLCEAARHMGYRTVVISEHDEDPAGRWADHHAVGDPRDPSTVARVARNADVVTVEFEQIPPEVLDAAEAAGARVAPAAHVQRTCRDRRLEKTFFADNGFPVGPFRIVESADAIEPAVAALLTAADGSPTSVVAKTARGGYDGKGQRWIKSRDHARQAWDALGGVPLMLEQAIPFIAETSVIVARSGPGQTTSFPMFRNEHRNGILFQTACPAGFADRTETQARQCAEGIAEKLGVIGLIAVEMFVLPDGSVVMNELAARPHNSGHVTLRACTRSQFELHIAAICGLPLPRVELLRPGVMTNLLGDLWKGHATPNWSALHADPLATLHLYGKSPRPGRKMGHMIHTAPTIEQALQAAQGTFSKL